MSNMGGLLFGPQCVIQSQNIPYEQNSYYRDFCELPQLQIAYLYIWTKYIKKNKANLRDLIAVTGLVILRKLDSNNWFFILYDLEIRWITSKKKCTSSRSHQALCIISKPSVNSNWGNNPEMLNSGQNGQFFVMCDLEIWQMTLKTTGHLLYAIASFVHHFIAVSQFKL